jgi:hypothetical protein
VRPNGDWLEFEADSDDAYIATVRNRRGSSVQLFHGPEGTLEEVISPTGKVFKFWLNTFLVEVSDDAYEPIWQISYGSDSVNSWITEVRDANGNRDHAWTYVADGNHNRVATEQGPGASAPYDDNALTFTYDTVNGETDVSFMDSQGNYRTNTFSYEAGLRARIRTKANAGSCPNCGRKRVCHRLLEP